MRNAMPLRGWEATIRAGALPSALRARDGRRVRSGGVFCCLAARCHRVDHSIVLEEYREARIVPTGYGRLAHGRVLLNGRAEVLLDLGHRATPLRSVDGGVTQGH